MGTRSLQAAERLLLAAALVTALLVTGGASAARQAPPTLTGSVTLVDQTWTCKQPVALDLVSVTITSAARTANKDGIHLAKGCTGTIARALGVRVVEVPDQGKGHAVRAIFATLAACDAVVLVDGDGTYPADRVEYLVVR